MPTARAPEGSLAPAVQLIPQSSLHFDLTNPRLGELESPKTESEAIAVLWREFAVDEVALSIAHNGYWPHEPLIVARESGKLIVVEGNRRLAAVRLLLDARLRKRLRATDLPTLRQSDARKLEQLPAVLCARKDVWQFLGFRHLNGPQNWRSFAKAQYIAQVHQDFGIPLSGIAEQIGDQHSTVERLYHGLLVLRQAESARVFSRDDCAKNHFSFSHLYTGLDYPGIRAFLGLSEKRKLSQNPVPANKLSNLGDLLRWLFGSRSADVEPLVRSQNPHLRQLDETLKSAAGIVALRRGAPLRTSLDISRGDERVFRESMQVAKQSLQEARGKLITGFHREEELLRVAFDVLQLATAIHREMGEIASAPTRTALPKRLRKKHR